MVLGLFMDTITGIGRPGTIEGKKIGFTTSSGEMDSLICITLSSDEEGGYDDESQSQSVTVTTTVVSEVKSEETDEEDVVAVAGTPSTLPPCEKVLPLQPPQQRRILRKREAMVLPNPKDGSRNLDKHVYECQHCEEGFDDREDMRRHVMTKHITPMSPKVVRFSDLPCSRCGKGYATLESLIIHETEHQNERPFKCEICKMGFTGNSYLQQHLRRSKGHLEMEGQLERKLQNTPCSSEEVLSNGEDGGGTKEACSFHSCSVCGKVFANDHELRKHFIVHTHEHPFRCNLCDRNYAKKSYYKKHLWSKKHKNSSALRLLKSLKAAASSGQVNLKQEKLEEVPLGIMPSLPERTKKRRACTFGNRRRPIYKCFKCGKAFLIKRNLKQHQLRNKNFVSCKFPNPPNSLRTNADSVGHFAQNSAKEPSKEHQTLKDNRSGEQLEAIQLANVKSGNVTIETPTATSTIPDPVVCTPNPTAAATTMTTSTPTAPSVGVAETGNEIPKNVIPIQSNIQPIYIYLPPPSDPQGFGNSMMSPGPPSLMSYQPLPFCVPQQLQMMNPHMQFGAQAQYNHYNGYPGYPVGVTPQQVKVMSNNMSFHPSTPTPVFPFGPTNNFYPTLSLSQMKFEPQNASEPVAVPTPTHCCSKCSTKFEDEKDLLLHLQTSHLNPNEWRCPVCNDVVLSSAELHSHYANKHSTG